jgi:hypothetical protein
MNKTQQSSARPPAWMLFLACIALIGVSAGIFLVVVSGRNKHALVRTDYYAAGLKLDEHRAAEAAFDSLGMSLSLRQESGALVVEAEGPGTGETDLRALLTAHDLLLELRRPDDPSADRDVALTLASDNPPLWVADAKPLRHGLWNVRAVFSKNGKPVMERTFTYQGE